LSTDGSLRCPAKIAAAGGVIRNDIGRFVKTFAANLGSCSITRVEMRAIVDGLNIAWFLGICRIRVQSDSMAVIAILLMTLLLIINMRTLLCNSRSYAAANENQSFLIFTVKLIMLRTIWLILATNLLKYLIQTTYRRYARTCSVTIDINFSGNGFI
ncbi:Putative ribonuclease H protein At1g65750, partial [Linum grandiflorum]